jgi:hypothetical protein
MSVRVLGIRHHGPGSARSLLRAFEEEPPDVILVEGPPEADALIPLASHLQMTPPVALLLYVPDEPQRAVYYPFARFSPEWQALRYATANAIPVRFMDLPMSHWLALKEESERRTEDPLNELARAAGYADGERWWEHMVEHRRTAGDVFAGVLEAMSAIRGDTPAEGLEALREAHMRQSIRAAQKEGFARVAVVCGAWHAPVLVNMPAVKDDTARLKGLAKIKVQATWIPWTHGRLQWVSGYGAGVISPGWYDHLWQHNDRVAVRWLSRVASLLRAQDLDASSGQIIDAVRLAETMAAMRGIAMPGLVELMEATESVLLFGNAAPMQLIREKLVVGEALGAVPDDTPALPLQRDVAAQQKRLRLAAEAGQRALDLDLRKPNDRERSQLLHRLRLLDVPWGNEEHVQRQSGTFHELWTIQWRPELSLAIVSAGVWGNTVESAATKRVQQDCLKLKLPELTGMLESTLKAGLPEATASLIARVASESAMTADLSHIMQATPALARIQRYGDVRETDTAVIGHVVRGMLARICVGLPVACGSLDDAAADAMRLQIRDTNGAVRLLDAPDLLADWQAALVRVADLPSINGVVAGACCRVLLDGGRFNAEDVSRRMQAFLSAAADPLTGGRWLEGFLEGSGVLLLHDESLWRLIDEWVIALKPEAFVAALPLLARTFSTFPAGERRQLGERVRSRQAAAGPVVEAGFDAETAAATIPLLRQLLGIGGPA